MRSRRFILGRRTSCYSLMIAALVIAGCGPSNGSSESDASPAAVRMPDVGQVTTVDRGVTMQQVSLPNGSAWRRLWIYLPDPLPQSKLPCVLIAPAGSPMITGMGLGSGDQPEHLPYAKAGFAVVAYELDGPFDPGVDDNRHLITAIQDFRKAEAGVADARAAIDYIVANRPEIDGSHLYSAGHSSAATVSLLVAMREPRIKACIAYAPGCDVESRIGETGVSELAQHVDGFRAFVHDASPISHATDLKCPLFLFHAEDDSVCSIEDSARFVSLVKSRNPNVTFVRVPTGEHYDSMIQQGVPRAIEWLKKLK